MRRVLALIISAGCANAIAEPCEYPVVDLTMCRSRTTRADHVATVEAIVDNGGAAIVSTQGDSPLRRQRNDRASAIENRAFLKIVSIEDEATGHHSRSTWVARPLGCEMTLS